MKHADEEWAWESRDSSFRHPNKYQPAAIIIGDRKLNNLKMEKPLPQIPKTIYNVEPIPLPQPFLKLGSADLIASSDLSGLKRKSIDSIQKPFFTSNVPSI